MWVLLLGGTAVSVSGFVLGLRYIGRLFRRKRRGHQGCQPSLAGYM